MSANDLRHWPISPSCRDQSINLGFDPEHPEQLTATPNLEAALLLPPSANITAQSSIGSRLRKRVLAVTALGSLLALCPARSNADNVWRLDPYPWEGTIGDPQPQPLSQAHTPAPQASQPTTTLLKPAPSLEREFNSVPDAPAGSDGLPRAPLESCPQIIVEKPVPPIAHDVASDITPFAAPANGSWIDTVHGFLPTAEVFWSATPDLMIAAGTWLIWRELRKQRLLHSKIHPQSGKIDTEVSKDTTDMNEAIDNEHIDPAPCPWSIILGGASHTGQVRTENQDAFAVRDVAPGMAISVTCDGVGGHPGGRAAARYCSRILKTRIEMGLIIGLSPQEAILDAFAHCVTQMETDGIEGLTTALITVVEGDCLTWAGLGDGRICVIHPDAMSQDVMAPHHALDTPSNVITAHLEAGTTFTPRMGSLRIEPDTLIFTMSDGAGDLFNLDSMAANRARYLKALNNCGPDLFASNILDRLEAMMHPNTKVPLHNDNLTLTVCLNPANPNETQEGAA